MAIRLVKLSTNLRIGNWELGKWDSISKGQSPVLTPCRLTCSDVRDDSIPFTSSKDGTMASIQNEPKLKCTIMATEGDVERVKNLLRIRLLWQLDDIGRHQLCYSPKRFSICDFNAANYGSKSSVLQSTFVNLPTQSNSPRFHPISRHMSSHKSLSSVKTQQLRVNVDEVIRSEIEDINEMIVMRRLGAAVIDEIYESLSMLIMQLGVPTVHTKESDKNFFVGSVLFSIAAFIRKECKYDLYVQSEAPLKDFNINIKGHMDFVVTDGKRKLVVIECKRHNADFCLVQCILALEHLYDANNDGADTYGFTTNGLEWRFVKYNGNSATKAKVFEKQTLITTYMHLPTRKERWLEHNTLLLHIIFSAILSAIEGNCPSVTLPLEDGT